MNPVKKFLSVLLVLVILIAISGCGTEPETPSTAPPATAPTTVPTTAAPTTEPAPDIAAIYTEALAPILAAAEISTVESKSFSVTVQGETFTSTESWTTSWKGLDTESYTASVTGSVDYDGETAKITEIFKDGTVYSTLSNYQGSYNGTSEMTGEDYKARYMPLAVLDPALYADLTMEESASGFILHLREAAAAETWLNLPAEAILVSAEGTVTMDSAKRLKSTVYNISYQIGGAAYEVQYSQELFSTVTVKEPPTSTDNYVPIGHPDVPKWFIRLDGHTLKAQNFTASISELIMSGAAGYSQVHTTELFSWGSGRTYLAKAEQDITVNDYSAGTTDSLNFVELFNMGQYSSITDGGAPEVNTQVTPDSMASYMTKSMYENTLLIFDLATAELTDLGGSIIIEYTMTDDFEKSIREYLNEYLYEDAEFLDNLAAQYTVDKLEGYLAFDKYTGLPTASGYEYSGTHVIYSQPYVLSFQIDQSIVLANQSGYYEVREEFPEEEAPETAPTPLFYKVTGSNGQTMWLLGTIHVGDNRTAHLPQVIYDAFKDADALAVECDVDAFEEQAETDSAIQELISNTYFYSDGSTTKDHIQDEELYTYALRMMKSSGNYNFNTLYFKPSVWGSSLDSFYLQQGYQLISEKGVDHRLLKMAREANKPIYEVESNEFQIGMLNGWSEELQEYLLLENCSYDYPAYCQSVSELYEAWLRGDEAELAEMISDEVDTSEMTPEELEEYEKHKDLLEEYNNAMGPDRNDDMLKVAVEYLESGETVFYAVGLAHLLAPDGLVHTLRDAGYTVELVSGTPAN